MLKGIINKSDVAKLQKAFQQRLNKLKSEDVQINIGYQGGSWTQNVSYSDELSIWWELSRSSNETRYWNAFGIGRPSKSANIVTEINYPIEGVDFRIAACWGEDEDGNVYLLHSGKIGGGRFGIGKSVFEKKYSGEYIDVNIDGNIRRCAIVGELYDANFPYQVASFVYEVAKVKGDLTKIPAHSFSDEFDGTKVFKLPHTVKATANHGLVVNALHQTLSDQGFSVGNNGSSGRIDLFTYNKREKITSVLEVKTSLSLQSVYTAIGQLLLYSSSLGNPLLFFVCPEGISKKTAAIINRLGILIISYQLKKGKASFRGLEKIK